MENRLKVESLEVGKLGRRLFLFWGVGVGEEEKWI